MLTVFGKRKRELCFPATPAKGHENSTLHTNAGRGEGGPVRAINSGILPLTGALAGFTLDGTLSTPKAISYVAEMNALAQKL